MAKPSSRAPQARAERPTLRRSATLTPQGFEPLVSALRRLRPGPLDDGVGADEYPNGARLSKSVRRRRRTSCRDVARERAEDPVPERNGDVEVRALHELRVVMQRMMPPQHAH